MGLFDKINDYGKDLLKGMSTMLPVKTYGTVSSGKHKDCRFTLVDLQVMGGKCILFLDDKLLPSRPDGVIRFTSPMNANKYPIDSNSIESIEYVKSLTPDHSTALFELTYKNGEKSTLSFGKIFDEKLSVQTQYEDMATLLGLLAGKVTTSEDTRKVINEIRQLACMTDV